MPSQIANLAAIYPDKVRSQERFALLIRKRTGQRERERGRDARKWCRSKSAAIGNNRTRTVGLLLKVIIALLWMQKKELTQATTNERHDLLGREGQIIWRTNIH